MKTVKGRWKNLRTYFFRECKKIEKHSWDESGAITTSYWHLFNRMQFLKTAIGVSQRDSSLPGQGIIDDPLSTTAEEDATYDMPTTPMSAESSYSFNIPVRKRKHSIDLSAQFEELLEMERKKTEFLQKETDRPMNDDRLFFESLLPYLKNIPKIRKLGLRIKIQELILSELENLPSSSSSLQS
nr:uncharacterized protein LOC112211929 [Halyomorpha halys]